MIYLLSPSIYNGVESLPMIEFNACVDSIDFQDCDMLLFTSKNGVKIANDIDTRWREYPSIAIGKETAKAIVQLGGRLCKVSHEAYATSVASLIQEEFSENKILYLSPKITSSDVLSSLVNRKIIYETKCVSYPKSKQPLKNSIIIVTSPSTFNCFVENFKWLDSYIVVAIGEVTANSLPSYVQYKIAPKPTIEACIAFAKELNTTHF